MAGGLIGFGVGSGVSGGIAEVFTKKEGGSSASFSAQVSKAREQVHKNPQNPTAWAALAEAQLHEAGSTGYYDQATESYTETGAEELRKAAKSWNRYLQLNPPKPEVGLANSMAAAFSSSVLNEPAKAVEAVQLVVAAEPPTAAVYSRLAEYAYLAHNVRQGDLASSKAVSLAPKGKQPLMELEFERMRKSAKSSSSSSSSGATTGTGAEAGG